MKFIAWAVGTLFVVWLTAFVGIKIYDLGCVASPTVCVAETGIWLRKLILLEWASKWQALIAGIGAVAGGAFVLFAAKIQIEHQRQHLEQEQLNEVVTSLFLISNFFYRACNEYKARRGDSLALVVRAETLAPTVTKCSPTLTNIMLSSIEHLRTKIEQKPTDRVPTAVFLYGTSSIFAEAAKYIRDRRAGTSLNASEIKFPSKLVMKYINDIKGEQKHLSSLKSYFDFPEGVDDNATT